ncbi:MAG: GldG family protein [Firmicutes bacterium]|nr:GldG family protein [Bacillota bacterium]MCD7782404.1 GldG family protein [Bacillota bacterium]
MKNTLGSLGTRKKFKYGATSVAFTVAFVAFILVINVIFSALASTYMWYIDMTDSELFTLSDATYTLMEDIDEDITITFCMDRDELESDSSMYYILNTARLLENEFDNVSIEYKNVLTDVAYLEKFTTASSPYVYTTSVIIWSGPEDSPEYRLYSYSYFFITDTEDSSYVWAYQGEKVFVSAMLQVTADEMPIAYFTTGHGESITDDEDATALVDLFYSAGYDVRTIDLSTEEIDEAARVIIINDPVYDFSGYGDTEVESEIDKIDAFLDDDHALIVFVDPSNAGNMTNLNEFLDEWGVVIGSGQLVYDPDNTISVDGYSVVGTYNSDEESLAASIYSSITSMSSQPKVIFREVAPLYRSSRLTSDTWTVNGTSRTISDVFLSSENAYITENGETSSETGQYSLMTITQEIQTVDSEYYTSYVLVSATSAYTASQYLLSNVYANSDVLYACMVAFGKERVPADIDFKVFNDYDLDITTTVANNWTYALVIVLPLVSVVTCTVVIVRRKNR